MSSPLSDVAFRIHPAINFARVGTSEEFYLSPETAAGVPIAGSKLMGGLPIVADPTERLIDRGDLRDANRLLKRQAARFRVFAYPRVDVETYPNGGGVELAIGSKLADGRTVTSIVWTVHLANKKANAHIIVPQLGAAAFENGHTPPLRNPNVVEQNKRLRQLIIDPGPRAIAGRNASLVDTSPAIRPSCSDGRGHIMDLVGYPTSYPHAGDATITSIGQLRTDDDGRLLVLPGYGRTATGKDDYGVPMPIHTDLNNDGWFDDTSDGPVSATLLFDDGSCVEAATAWVVCTDPAFAPQIRNVVTAWDDVYDVWVRELALLPSAHDGGTFKSTYAPSFDDDIAPIFAAVSQQRWTTNLPRLAIRAHEAVGAITAADDPNGTVLAGLAFLRNPNVKAEENIGAPLMPLSLGDGGKPFLSVTRTQFFVLEQWSKGKHTASRTRNFGAGELLDMAALANCLGGRYVPGLEVSYPVRLAEIYARDWTSSGRGPFRLHAKTLPYASARADRPFLSDGWIPNHDMIDGLEPGDLSKFMAVPWQADYNSCSIHPYTYNTDGDQRATGNPRALYWSWPAQRPDSVHVAQDVVGHVLAPQRWSIRGAGTYASDPATASSFQLPTDAVAKWSRIGIVIQGPAIAQELSPQLFLEVESLLDDPPTADSPVERWPFNSNSDY